MSSIESLKNQKSRWLLVAPVSGLVLTTVVNEEITINNITFVSSARLPYVRKRLGFPITINELKKIVGKKCFLNKIVFMLLAPSVELDLNQKKSSLSLLKMNCQLFLYLSLDGEEGVIMHV